jgi:chromate transporter
MKNISLRDIFCVFLKIGTFAFGGAYSMLSFFERELVEKKKWLTHEEYLESVAIGQITPGPPIVNTGICIGYKLRKIKGVLATTVGQAFTGTLLAIILAVFYVKAGDSPLLHAAMKGVGASVVGLLISVVYRMSTKILVDLRSRLLALAAFVALAVFKLNPIGLIIAAGLAGLIVYRRQAS